MQFDELLSLRQSVRAFKSEQITDDELERVIDAGRRAPSGRNKQATHFVAIQSAETIHALQEKIRDCFASMPDPGEGAPMRMQILKSRERNYRCMYNPPTFILVANERDNVNAIADTSLAMGNMMLKASELGLGSCWISQVKRLTDHPDMRAFLSTLGISEDEIVCASLSLGYPDQPLRAPKELKGNRVDYIH